MRSAVALAVAHVVLAVVTVATVAGLLILKDDVDRCARIEQSWGINTSYVLISGCVADFLGYRVEI